jgi:hypothetical protein
MTTKSKRKEPFRYRFSSPTECTFEITRINETPVSAKPAEAAIIDISKSGCKLYTKLNLNAMANRIQLLVNLIIDGQPKKFRGTVRWQMQTEQSYYYGVQLELIEAEKDRMLLEIRSLAVSHKIEVI